MQTNDLRTYLIKFLQQLFARVGISINRVSTIEKLIENIRDASTLKFIQQIEVSDKNQLIELSLHSKSQRNQDLLVAAICHFKKGGYFVEFGATNGVDLSNTHLLEKRMSWKGILAEPAKQWHNDLLKNRSVHISKDCVWSTSGQDLDFTEVGELSTLVEFKNNDGFILERARKPIYKVRTISLFDLLQKYKAPAVIEYLSVDTEGSEFEILKNFPFDRYTFKVITVEHNYSANRKAVADLLTSNGYKQIYENLSEWEDWFIFPEAN